MLYYFTKAKQEKRKINARYKKIFFQVPNNLSTILSNTQYAEAGCYNKKKFSIKQAFFINEIFSSRVKAPKQNFFF